MEVLGQGSGAVAFSYIAEGRGRQRQRQEGEGEGTPPRLDVQHQRCLDSVLASGGSGSQVGGGGGVAVAHMAVPSFLAGGGVGCMASEPNEPR